MGACISACIRLTINTYIKINTNKNVSIILCKQELARKYIQVSEIKKLMNGYRNSLFAFKEKINFSCIKKLVNNTSVLLLNRCSIIVK